MPQDLPALINAIEVELNAEFVSSSRYVHMLAK